jgi:hypothetical protein
MVPRCAGWLVLDLQKGSDMFEIIFMACSALNLVSCKAVHITLLGELDNPRTCIVAGQLEAVKYVEKHPEWIIKGWRCGSVDLAKKEI